MNHLSLRISKVRLDDKCKNSYLKYEMLKLPDKSTNAMNQGDLFFGTFFAATNLDMQLNAVKNITTSSSSLNQQSVNLISDIMFQTELKHPLRGLSAKVLQKFEDQKAVKTALMRSIDGLTSPRKFNEKLHHKIEEKNTKTLMKASHTTPRYTENCSEILNRDILSLIGCFDNFPNALAALAEKLALIFQLVIREISNWLLIITYGNDLSPSEINNLHTFIHNALRLGLLCIQVSGETTQRFELKEYHEDLSLLSSGIIKDSNMPMNVRINCGTMVAYLSQIISEVECPIEASNCTKLCYCIGFLNSKKCEKFAFEKCFETVDEIIDIAYSSFIDPTILLSASRSIYHFFKNTGTSYSIYQQAEATLRNVLDFSCAFIDHNMDSVRHLCQDLLQKIIAIICSLKSSPLENQLSELTKTTSNSTVALKSTIIGSLAKFWKCDKIFKQLPNLFEEFFESNLGEETSVTNCYYSLMVVHHKESDYDAWLKKWIIYLMKFAERHDDRVQTVEELLKRSIKIEPKICDYAISCLTDERKCKNEQFRKQILYSMLCIARINRIDVENSKNIDETLNRLYEQLKIDIICKCDDTRITILQLIIETPKSTQNFTENELEILLLYMKYSLHCQNPAARTKGIKLLTKALSRIAICSSNYHKFLREFLNMLRDNFFDDANFSRRLAVLLLLEKLLEILPEKNFFLELDEIKMLGEKVFDVLYDSYESNKALAVRILVSLGYWDERCHWPLIDRLMVSIRPNDSTTAGYMLLYMMRHFEESHCKLIQNRANVLEKAMQIAEKSVFAGIKSNPLFGCLFAIRLLLMDVNYEKACSLRCDCWVWFILIPRIISICFKCSEIVSPIVNNSAPEGYMPENDETDDISEFSVGDSGEVTAQSVLLFSWRTMKEASLLLGEIVKFIFTVQHERINQINFLNSPELVHKIGDHFKVILSEIKHRGAFEQAYVGFHKVCTILWRTKLPKFNKLPMEWLRESLLLISEVDGTSKAKICSTRRSAGVPFMIQALITSEIQLGTKLALDESFQVLIKISSDFSATKEIRTHSMNILRALFRCTDLRDVIGEYICFGIVCALQGYKAESWLERNSATLLFSALMTRIFGVQRTKEFESLHIRNRMTGRIFFLRYPKLYDFFLTELKSASRMIAQNQRPRALQALLVLLNRLYPSTLEGIESNLKLSKFIPFISMCSKSPEMQTRILVAKAISSFVIIDDVEKRIDEIVKEMECHNAWNLNYAHGMLLQVYHLMKRPFKKSIEMLEHLTGRLLSLQEHFIWNPVVTTSFLHIFIEIFKSQSLSPLFYQRMKNLLRLLQNGDRENFSSCYPVYLKTRLIFEIYTIRENIDCTENLMNIAKLIGKIICNHMPSSYEEKECALNLMLLIFNHTNGTDFEFSKMEKDLIGSLNKLDNKPTAYNDERIPLRIDSISRKETFLWTWVLEEISVLRKMSSNHHQYHECSIKAFSLLRESIAYLLNGDGDNLAMAFNVTQECIETALSGSVDEKIEAAILLQEMTDIEEEHKIAFIRERSEMLMVFLKETVQAKYPLALRLNSAKIIVKSPLLFLRYFQAESEIEKAADFYHLVISLLGDDDIEVREILGDMIASMFSGYDNKFDYIARHAQLRFSELMVSLIQEQPHASKIIDCLRRGFAVNENSILSTSKDPKYLEIFDKNETNVYFERSQAIRDFHEVVNQRPLYKKLATTINAALRTLNQKIDDI